MNNLINLFLFQGLWLSCILGAAKQTIWPAAVIVSCLLVLFLSPKFRHKNDSLFLFVCLPFGFALDSLLAYFGLIDYAHNFGFVAIAPVWIMFLWIGFSLTLNHSMAWLLQKPKLGSLFMLIGAPLSYFSAEKLGAIVMHKTTITLIVISVLWLLVYYLLLVANQHTQRQLELNHV